MSNNQPLLLTSLKLNKSVGKDCIPNKPTGASHVSQASNLCQTLHSNVRHNKFETNLNKPSVCKRC